MSGLRTQVLDQSKADQDQHVRRQREGFPLSGTGLRRHCGLERGIEMKITVMGMILIVVGGVVLLALVAYLLEQGSNDKGKDDDQPSPA